MHACFNRHSQFLFHLFVSVHITQVYASWSQHLNRQIYAALAIANGFATEALGNIRTVKAFAAEKQETAKFNEAILTSLQKGIIDAFGGAGMSDKILSLSAP